MKPIKTLLAAACFAGFTLGGTASAKFIYGAPPDYCVHNPYNAACQWNNDFGRFLDDTSPQPSGGSGTSGSGGSGSGSSGSGGSGTGGSGLGNPGSGGAGSGSRSPPYGTPFVPDVLGDDYCANNPSNPICLPQSPPGVGGPGWGPPGSDGRPVIHDFYGNDYCANNPSNPVCWFGNGYDDGDYAGNNLRPVNCNESNPIWWGVAGPQYYDHPQFAACVYRRDSQPMLKQGEVQQNTQAPLTNTVSAQSANNVNPQSANVISVVKTAIFPLY